MLDNINPKIWGSTYWKMLHFVTFSYPDVPSDDDKINIKNFFMSFKEIIPCEKCRANFKNHLIKYPINDNTISSKYNLMMWLINIHNEVNLMTGKPILTLDDCISFLNSNNSMRSINKNIVILILLVILIIVLIVYSKYRNNQIM